jgi:hypothetical protein
MRGISFAVDAAHMCLIDAKAKELDESTCYLRTRKKLEKNNRNNIMKPDVAGQLKSLPFFLFQYEGFFILLNF